MLAKRLKRVVRNEVSKFQIILQGKAVLDITLIANEAIEI